MKCYSGDLDVTGCPPTKESKTKLERRLERKLKVLGITRKDVSDVLKLMNLITEAEELRQDDWP